MRTWHVLSRNILYSVIISNALSSIWSLFFILPHGHQKINLSFMVEWCPVLSFRAMTKKQTCYSRSDKSDFLEKTNNKIRQTDKLPSVELRGARFWRSPLRFFGTLMQHNVILYTWIFRSKFSDRPNKYSAKAHKDVIQSLHIAWSFLWHHFPPPALWNNVTRLLRRESLELNESLTRVYREFNESLTRSGPGCKSLHSGLRCFEWRHWLQWWQCQSLHLGLSC